MVNKERFLHYYDYGWFKDNVQEMSYKSLSVYAENGSKPRKVTPKLINLLSEKHCPYSRIGFRVDDKLIMSRSTIPLSCIIRITEYLSDRRTDSSHKYEEKERR